MYRDKETGEFIEELLAAARRGVDVAIATDFMTFFNSLRDPRDIPLTYRSKSARDTRSLKKEFEKAGASFRFLGQHTPLFVTRTHSKWLVADDTVFAFGGVNTEAAAVENADFMFKFCDAELADSLVKQQRVIERADKERHFSRNLAVKTSFGEVLFDGSTIGRSLIYDRMVGLAEEATEILLVTQYCPSGKLARLLNKKKSRVYFNPWQNADYFFNRWIIRGGQFLNRQNNLYKRKKYLHAKFAIFTMADGMKAAITGSHNFVATAGKLGTREVALLTQDEEIIGQLEAFFESHVK
jgi:cardiolipin synthase